MSRLHAWAAAVVLAGFAACPAAASAAPITETLAFTASGFLPGAPLDPVTGSFTITFDPAVDQAPIALPSFASTLGAAYNPFSFQYSQGDGAVQIGDNCRPGFCEVTPNTNQAFLFFQVDAAGAPVPGRGALEYSAVGFQSIAESLSLVLAAVPEPASLLLLATGMLGLTFAVRRRN